MPKNAKPAIDVNSGTQVQIDRPEGTLCYFDGDGLGWISPQNRNKLSDEERAKRVLQKEVKRRAWDEKVEASRQRRSAKAREKAAIARARAAELESQAAQLEG